VPTAGGDEVITRDNLVVAKFYHHLKGTAGKPKLDMRCCPWTSLAGWGDKTRAGLDRMEQDLRDSFKQSTEAFAAQLFRVYIEFALHQLASGTFRAGDQNQLIADFVNLILDGKEDMFRTLLAEALLDM
jgi:hypothetical protein